jgi:bifunctional NMN adenylyltransferase/nudix hydrolase
MKHVGVLIGRFQPFHLGHEFLLNEAARYCDEILILIGSSYRARSIKNPWTYTERCAMIRAANPTLPIHFAAIPDYFYAEDAWFKAVQQAAETRFPQAQFELFGHTKDSSSYYLQHFPSWNLHECPDFNNINATEIRQALLLKQTLLTSLLPTAVTQILNDFMHCPLYANLCAEAHHIQEYRQSWAHAPYPPIFSTVDSIVICNEQILLIERGHPPGKGLLALPGGFLEVNEWARDGLIRELIEETQIKRSRTDLQSDLQQIKVYDYPDRSNIGRVITHAGLFILNLDAPPPIQAHDDAAQVFWHPIANLSAIQDQFHDDHYQIIRDILDQQGILKWASDKF